MPVLRILAIAAAALLLPMLGYRDFWDSAEGRPPLVARDILATGRLQPPYLNGEPYLNKPPLFHALVASSFWLLGESETAARLPSVLAAIAAILLTAAIARDAYGDRAALVAGAFLLLSWRFFTQARSSELETTLTASVALFTLAFLRAARRDGPRGRAPWLVAAAFAGAAGMLTKGPLALLFIALFVFATAAVERRAKALLAPAFWAAMAGASLAAFAFYGPLWSDVAIRELLEERAKFENVKHEHGFLYYAGALPPGLLPAILLVPVAWWKGRQTPAAPRTISETCVVAAAAAFLVFSSWKSKQSHYLLPLYPWIAIAAGGLIARYLKFTRPTLATALGVAVLTLAAEISWTAFVNDEKSAKPAVHKFLEVTRGAPLATTALEPPTVFYLARKDLVLCGSPEDARRFLDLHPQGFVLREHDRGAVLPDILAGLSVASTWRSPSEKQAWVLLAPGRGH